ncbi:hypothetical protein PVAP13_9NG386719, partial [Panicum virgatum]
PVLSQEISCRHKLEISIVHNQMASPPTQHKQNARTNQTWTRARALDSGTKRCSITPGITAHASAAQQDLTHQICDLMTSPPPQQHHSLPPSCADTPNNRIRKKQVPERNVRTGPDRGRGAPGSRIQSAGPDASRRRRG